MLEAAAQPMATASEESPLWLCLSDVGHENEDLGEDSEEDKQ